MTAGVFLDRDGVINRCVVRAGKPYPPLCLEEFELLPGVPEAIEALRAAGFCIIVVTNQPDVATKTQDISVVEEMHRRLRASLPVDDIRVCYHIDADDCACRKPKPGMLVTAAHDFGIDLERSFMVGDRWRDVGAGRAAGCRSIFIDHGYREKSPDSPICVVSSLAEAASFILSQPK